MQLTERRNLYDALAKYGIAIGGTGVILAIVLIFFYLLYVVIPLFFPADVNTRGDYAFGEASSSVHLDMEELGETGVRLTADGRAAFFTVADGKVSGEPIDLGIPSGTRATSFAIGQPASSVAAFGLSDGRAIVIKYGFDIEYPNDV
ncbi:MAG: phosphate ABC transporter permease, partial [Gammaproteobacteria bacterium]